MPKQILPIQSVELSVTLFELDTLCDEMSLNTSDTLNEIIREWLYCSGEVRLEAFRRRRNPRTQTAKLLRFPTLVPLDGGRVDTKKADS